SNVLIRKCYHNKIINFTKIALHRTRLRFADCKNFQLGFFTNHSARPRHNWGCTASRELKRVKRISAFFSLALLKNHHHLS
ncbi:hypothetical protein, partial [Enterobacter cloacae]|uniref:hypothetical protein n=1 Tax=Enterobacter cloacae TaxID=550 RepID=UPI0020CF6879